MFGFKPLPLSKEQLAVILHGNKEIDAWYAALIKILPKYKINTPKRIAAFLSQCGHESKNFTVLEENLNYSAEGLNRVFPKYFKNVGRNAAAYHRKPEAIANLVYANRMGNGDVASGEGYKYRGRGVIQLTGKDNYGKFATVIGKTLDETVNYVKTKEGALESACWFWNSRGLNEAADAGDIVKVSKLINGGTNGLEDRIQRYEHAINVLTK